MKENARLASDHGDGKGAIQLIAQHVQRAKQKLSSADKLGWELHIVGHSAGSIFAAHAVHKLAELNIPIRSVQFLAPAIRIDTFSKHLLPKIQSGLIPLPSLYLLSDKLERDDCVGPYGKSLLYLVSQAFEGTRGVPLLGMAACLERDPALKKLFQGTVDGRPALIESHGTLPESDAAARQAVLQGASASRTHGGFDNDCATLNSVLVRVLGGAPKRSFKPGDLKY
jgi:hypothetical protein